jgi:hypothetical protein
MSKYWFRKRKGLFTKDLGWGWVPISWEGGVVIIIFVLLILFFAWFFQIWNKNATFERALYFLFS